MKLSVTLYEICKFSFEYCLYHQNHHQYHHHPCLAKMDPKINCYNLTKTCQFCDFSLKFYTPQETFKTNQQELVYYFSETVNSDNLIDT